MLHRQQVEVLCTFWRPCILTTLQANCFYTRRFWSYYRCFRLCEFETVFDIVMASALTMPERPFNADFPSPLPRRSHIAFTSQPVARWIISFFIASCLRGPLRLDFLPLCPQIPQCVRIVTTWITLFSTLPYMGRFSRLDFLPHCPTDASMSSRVLRSRGA